MQLAGKHIVLGVTGSIAAYKAATLIRLLVKEGAEVRVLMTPLAKEFIAPLTMATLSGHPILVEFFTPENGEWNSHVKLGLWADLLLIAPATANTLAKMAHGVADNLLLTTYLSAKCPTMVAPAMDLDMYSHPATQQNLQTLRERGNTVLESPPGELASGLSGKGRMMEPEQIAARVAEQLAAKPTLQHLTVLITSGPTHEPIDPVRFIGNHSSGKMGSALAMELAMRGARVILITGPAATPPPQHPLIEVVHVSTAQQMHQQATARFGEAQVAIMAAAVADFTPEAPALHKMKRDGNQLSIKLKPTADIAAALGAQKRPNQLLVGFALETQNEEQNARLKLQRKNLDLIVLNSMNDRGAGFGHDTNKVSLIAKDGTKTDFELKPKADVARDIVTRIAQMLP
ncbi:MAG: bifunctional phosphopantothenoylcysteine decarboxylase/phosphopantothenate--cysteine ligase CoaBC [Bacteroidales bacterium]|nr:bifunctional phosphopantothenoylcysteine decarboxylase/phosphopantothenate--cysteine ligase CoaBC [Bacteroidales bacterium]